MTRAKPNAEDMLYDDLLAEGMPPVRQHVFHGEKLWRFDFAYPPLMLAIEVDGRGRHQTDKGRTEDCDKLNAASELGWKILRYPAGRITVRKRRERIVEQIKRCVCGISCEISSACVLVGE